MTKAPHNRTFQGLPIHIEHDRGDTRSGVSPDGTEWSTKMKHPYGEILGTTGADGDPLDVFIGPNPHAAFAYVVQAKLPGSRAFDEVKIMAGFNTRAEAEAAFRVNYDRPGFMLDVTTWPMPALVDVIHRFPEIQRGRLDAAALAKLSRMAKARAMAKSDDPLAMTLHMPGQHPAIGAESGRARRSGIAKHVSPHGSTRYLHYHEGRPVAGLQVVSRDGVHAKVANVYTHPEHRRRGLASALMTRARQDFHTVEHADGEHQSEDARRWITGMSKARANLLPGGRGDDLDPEDVDPDALAEGIEHEMEHTRDRRVAREIAIDHLAEDRAYYRKLRALEKAHVNHHVRKLKDGRIIQVTAHERKDPPPVDAHEALRRAAFNTVARHGRPMSVEDLRAKLPKRHRNADPKALDDVLGHLMGFGLLSPHADGVTPGHEARPEPAPAKGTPLTHAAGQLVYAWRDHPDATTRGALARVMESIGMKRLHAAGDVVPFDGLRHQGGDAWPGEPVQVVEPGWVMPGDVGDRVMEPAKVQAPGTPAPAPRRLSSPADLKRSMVRELVGAWNHTTHPDARAQLERAMVGLGMKRHGTPGEAVVFDGKQHVGDGMFAGDAAEVEHPGWSVEDEQGHVMVQKAKVRTAGAGFATDFEREFDRLSRNRTFGVVELWALRDAMPTHSRAVFDRELVKLRQAGRFELWTADGRHHVITPQERDAAIEERGQQYYYVVRSGGD